jgi:D-methionine transport system substrate-binding protein
MFKKTALIATVSAAILGVTGCGAIDSAGGDEVGSTSDGVTTLKVGATPVPHAQILEYVRDNLAEKAGLDLEIVQYQDYVQPNVALDEGELDANYFQHLPYLEAEEKEKGYDFAPYEGIHLEPFALYSQKVTDVQGLPEGATVAINNDPSNQGRALDLLAQSGLITLKSGTPESAATLYDVDENPKNIEFVETDPAQLPRSLQDVDAAVINGNYALETEELPKPILTEEVAQSPYANMLVVREGTQSDPALKELDALLHSPQVKRYIERTWPSGQVVPAF